MLVGGEVLSEQARQLSNRKTNFRIPGYKSELFPGLISKSKKPQLFRFWAGGKTFAPRVIFIRTLRREEKSLSRACQVGQLFPCA